MNSLATICLLAFVLSAAITAAAVPGWRAVCRRTGHVDEPGPRKIHTESVPLAGGPAIFSGLLVALVVLATVGLAGWGGVELSHKLRQGIGHSGGQLLVVLAGAVGMLVLGWLDDEFELRAGPKFGAQCVLAASLVLADVRFALGGPVFNYFFSLLWILTVVNAFNFTDNMNGLCGGLAVIGGVGLGLNACFGSQSAPAVWAFGAAGAAFGFLPANFPRATIFLGDSGSHLLGYCLATAAMLSQRSVDSPSALRATLGAVLALAIPLVDLFWVVVLRSWRGRPFYLGDTNHLSHQLVRLGFPPTQAVLMIWGIAAVVSVLGIWWSRPS